MPELEHVVGIPDRLASHLLVLILCSQAEVRERIGSKHVHDSVVREGACLRVGVLCGDAAFATSPAAFHAPYTGPTSFGQRAKRASTSAGDPSPGILATLENVANML